MCLLVWAQLPPRPGRSGGGGEGYLLLQWHFLNITDIFSIDTNSAALPIYRRHAPAQQDLWPLRLTAITRSITVKQNDASTPG
jgi:hypothetical protein